MWQSSRHENSRRRRRARTALNTNNDYRCNPFILIIIIYVHNIRIYCSATTSSSYISLGDDSDDKYSHYDIPIIDSEGSKLTNEDSGYQVMGFPSWLLTLSGNNSGSNSGMSSSVSSVSRSAPENISHDDLLLLSNNDIQTIHRLLDDITTSYFLEHFTIWNSDVEHAEFIFLNTTLREQHSIISKNDGSRFLQSSSATRTSSSSRTISLLYNGNMTFVIPSYGSPPTTELINDAINSALDQLTFPLSIGKDDYLKTSTNSTFQIEDLSVAELATISSPSVSPSVSPSSNTSISPSTYVASRSSNDYYNVQDGEDDNGDDNDPHDDHSDENNGDGDDDDTSFFSNQHGGNSIDVLNNDVLDNDQQQQETFTSTTATSSYDNDKKDASDIAQIATVTNDDSTTKEFVTTIKEEATPTRHHQHVNNSDSTTTPLIAGVSIGGTILLLSAFLVQRRRKSHYRYDPDNANAEEEEDYRVIMGRNMARRDKKRRDLTRRDTLKRSLSHQKAMEEALDTYWNDDNTADAEMDACSDTVTEDVCVTPLSCTSSTPRNKNVINDTENRRERLWDGSINITDCAVLPVVSLFPLATSNATTTEEHIILTARKLCFGSEDKKCNDILFEQEEEFWNTPSNNNGDIENNNTSNEQFFNKNNSSDWNRTNKSPQTNLQYSQQQQLHFPTQRRKRGGSVDSATPQQHRYPPSIKHLLRRSLSGAALDALFHPSPLTPQNHHSTIDSPYFFPSEEDRESNASSSRHYAFDMDSSWDFNDNTV